MRGRLAGECFWARVMAISFAKTVDLRQIFDKLNISINNINNCYSYVNYGENHDESAEEKSPAPLLLQG